MATGEYLDWSARVLGIIGPSGSGKSSVVHILNRRGLIDITPTWTTRPPRHNELEEGIEHRFVSEDRYDELEREDYFINTEVLFGLPYRYGMPRILVPSPDKAPTVMLRVMVLDKMDRFYPNNLIYQIEDRLPEIERRLREREAKGENTGTRIQQYRQELEAGRKKANRVFTNTRTLEKLADEVAAAIAEDFGLN